MKKALQIGVTFCFAFCSFFTCIKEVFASNSKIIVDTWQVSAHQYWYNMGYNSFLFSNDTSQTYEFNYYDTDADEIWCEKNNSSGDYNCYAFKDNQQVDFSSDKISSVTTKYNAENVFYSIPWLSKLNTYSRPTEFDLNRSITIGWYGDYYLAFYSNVNLYYYTKPYAAGMIANLWEQNNHLNSLDISCEVHSEGTGSYFYVFKFHNREQRICRVTIDIGGNLSKVIPFYCGDGTDLDSTQKEMLLIPNMEVKAINELKDALTSGTAQSQEYIEQSQSVTNSFNTSSNALEAFESSSIDDMNNKLSLLPSTSSLITNNKFLNSASWVRTQFNNINSGPFATLLEFSLLLGIALIFIGKIR